MRTIQPVAGEPSLGTLHMLATPVTVLNAGVATVWTDVDCSGSTPVGAKALLFCVHTSMTAGPAGTSYNVTELRKNGTGIAEPLTRGGEVFLIPSINGTRYDAVSEKTVECDAGRIIEYLNYAAGCAGGWFSTLILCGYYL